MARTFITSFLYGRERATEETRRAPWSSVVLVGRVLLAAIFVVSGIAKIADWSGTAAYMRDVGLTQVTWMLALAAAVEILGGLSILTGTFARLGALALFLYLIPVTLVFHDFWTLTGMERQAQLASFMKNLSIMGGLLILLGYGAGRVSLDNKIEDSFD